jgi:hypothetical protein
LNKTAGVTAGIVGMVGGCAILILHFIQ